LALLAPEISAVLKNRKVAICQQHFDRSPVTAKFGTVMHYWHVDVYLPYRQLKIRQFNKPRWYTAAVLTIEKSGYVGKGLTDRDDLTGTHINPD